MHSKEKLLLFGRFLIIVTLSAYSFSPVVGDETMPPQAFNQCANCHTTAAEGQHRNAPSLNGIVGREIASLPDFDYSDALKAEKGIWTKARLDRYLQKPAHAVTGTKMYFRGLRSAAERNALINWLAKNSVPTVSSPNSKKPTLGAIARTERAKKLFRPCTGCHSYTKDAPAKIGPNLFGVVGRPVASFPGFDYTARILARGGAWDADSLHIFFTEKKSFGQGSHIAFRTLKEKEDRDLIIEYLGALSNNQD